MRILYISHLHPPEDAPLQNMGGMQRVSMQLVRELREREDIAVHSEIMHASWKGIGLKTTGFLLKEIFRLPRIAHRFKADVILFSSMVTAALARFVRSRVEIPMVTINHGQDVTLPVGIYQWFVPKIFGSLDGVISVSLATRDECIKRGMNPEKGVALPNGVDLESLDHFPGKEVSRNFLANEFGMDLDDKYLLLSVGRMVRRKGHEWYIRNVLPELAGNVVYVAVGDGPEFENVERIAGESAQRGRIFLLGRQPDSVLKQCYSAADLFIMPNIPVEGDMEGFGIVMLEANMARTPVIASDLEGIKDVITDGQNGYKVPVLDGNKFAEIIKEVLSGDLESFSEKSRNFVRNRFGWKRVADEYLDFLEETIERYKYNKKMN